MLCLDKVEEAVHAAVKPLYVNHYNTLYKIDVLPLDIIRVIMSLWYEVHDDVQNLRHDYIYMMMFNIFTIQYIALSELYVFCPIFADKIMSGEFAVFLFNVVRNIATQSDISDALIKIDAVLFEKLIRFPSTHQNLRRCWDFLDKDIGKRIYIDALTHKTHEMLTKKCYLYYRT